MPILFGIGSGARSDGAGSVDSFDSDEELSVGEEGSLKIDWEGRLHRLTIGVEQWNVQGE